MTPTEALLLSYFFVIALMITVLILAWREGMATAERDRAQAQLKAAQHVLKEVADENRHLRRLIEIDEAASKATLELLRVIGKESEGVAKRTNGGPPAT